MSLRLETSSVTLGGAAIAATLVVTLAAVMIALLPSMAEAQTPAPTEGKSNPSVVVRPGDSLWSISEGRLGPNATPQRVAEATERIHALNRGRIGADPDLIFVGQELLVPPAPSEGPTVPSAAPKTAHAAETTPRDRAAEGTTGKAPKPVPKPVAGGADTKGGEAPEAVAQQKGQQEAQQEAEPVGLPALPDEAEAAPVPAVRAVASNGSPTSPVASLLRTIRAEVASVTSTLAESFFAASADAGTEGRRLLGLGVMALTLLGAALMAWKLPMRRTTRQDVERWGTPSGYYGYHGETPAAPGTTSFFYHPGSLGGPLGDRDEQGARREAPRAPGVGQRAVFVGSGTASSPGVARTPGGSAGRGRAPRAKARAGAVPRNGLALGAHNPEVRRAPRRARATIRARRLRPRLRHGRGVSARGGR